jgi:Holliday junction DNA helicase RuvA
MIGRLRGELIQKTTGGAVVECGGVGYACSISLATFGSLPDEGREVTLFVETLLRENDLSLLGFASARERSLYRLLVRVDGVGPKLALAALGALPLEELVSAVRVRDTKALTRIPGVGKKTAEKMCFELSEKLGGLGGLDGLAGDAGDAPPIDPWESNLRSALVNLGFREDAVMPLLAQFRQGGHGSHGTGGDGPPGAGGGRPPLADAIRACLKSLRR